MLTDVQPEKSSVTNSIPRQIRTGMQRADINQM
jgi:hypothetical protein